MPETTPGPGHNSDKGISAQQLKSFIERIERLEEEKKALAADIREIYAEAKSGGFDTKIMRHVVKLRKMDAAERRELESLIDVYLDALGELGPTPLGQAAIERVRNSAPAKALRKSIASGEVSIELPRGDGTRVRIDKDGEHTVSA